ncbi:MAG: alkaline phosphatase D family protein [Actinobacteria bacterium]|nr:alkaline phosphatase D family protein [Actinomycetota bacterium]
MNDHLDLGPRLTSPWPPFPRRAATALVAVCLALGGLIATDPAEAISHGVGGDAQRSANEIVLNVGHRGASGYAPEHTIASYDLALELGADYIEQDLQLTRDGILVSLHDETLDRTTKGPSANCTGLVITKTLRQIKTCDVGSWFNETYPQYARPEYVGLKIPTLEQVFRRYGKSTNYYIETKNPEAAPGMEQELLRLMDKYELSKPAAERWQVLVQSFSPTSLQKTHRLRPRLPLIQLLPAFEGTTEVAAPLDLVRTYAVGIGPSKNDTDAELIAAAHSRCLDVHPYTVNEANEMANLIELGVDGMFTNFPDRLDDVLAEDAVPGKRGSRLAANGWSSCISHGIASGEVRPHRAVVWARTNGRADVRVAYDSDVHFSSPQFSRGEAGKSKGFAAKVTLGKLDPGTVYYYKVTATSGHGAAGTSHSPVGRFKTPPEPSDGAPVSFVWGGDVGGQGYCRRVGEGYPIFSTMQSLNPDFFVANGDMIYADGDCPAEGPDGAGGWENIPGDFPSIIDPTVDWTDRAVVREVYRDHWRYNRADPDFQRFLRSTSMYAQWDDHEVVNDFGARWNYWNADNKGRAGYKNLVQEGRKALFDFNPLRRKANDRNRIYRAFRWGHDLDVSIIDARSYRSRNDVADTAMNDKTLLGREQLRWLKHRLANSDATWKVVSSDVPISVPTGSDAGVFGRDAWADGTEPDFSARTGFERELSKLLRFLDRKDIANVVFVTTDVHFADSIRYSTDADGDGDRLLFHEFITGPLNAIAVPPAELDPTFSPTSLYAEGELFNFGHIRIEMAADGQPRLSASVIDEAGDVRPGSEEVLAPR